MGIDIDIESLELPIVQFVDWFHVRKLWQKCDGLIMNCCIAEPNICGFTHLLLLKANLILKPFRLFNYYYAVFVPQNREMSITIHILLFAIDDRSEENFRILYTDKLRKREVVIRATDDIYIDISFIFLIMYLLLANWVEKKIHVIYIVIYHLLDELLLEEEEKILCCTAIIYKDKILEDFKEHNPIAKHEMGLIDPSKSSICISLLFGNWPIGIDAGYFMSKKQHFLF
ncbi:hypothetical protein ACJX0J_039291, partial [Zea mays]